MLATLGTLLGRRRLGLLNSLLRALTVVDFAEQVIKLWPVTEGICTSAGWDCGCRTVLQAFVGPAGQPVEPKINPTPGCSCRLFVWLCSP